MQQLTAVWAEGDQLQMGFNAPGVTADSSLDVEIVQQTNSAVLTSTHCEFNTIFAIFSELPGPNTQLGYTFLTDANTVPV